ncbi:hypothetical protein [Lacibacter sediminis]|uniref:Uncharacterized protein n=1 Tax=Lacibacter sediminis TaxID=2760713 RepID=A0A7G5XI86_9BACT|nr:hypothetical protein [Lacibacter sediminis]QNA45189.1 hypothetical protein H4075_03025 [Lacibacter sediminis]
MKSRFLFSYQFKRAGVFMAPLGFIIWVLLQRKVISVDLPSLKTGLLIISFCSFLIGMAFLVLSKEKTEDEYTRKVRLESYQFSALIQFFLLLGLTILVLFFENSLGRLVFEQMSIFIILFFWLTYFIRFNFVLYSSKSFNGKDNEE